MKITHGPGIVKRELIDAMINGKHVLRKMKDGKQLWPDNRRRVQRIIVDTTPLHASPVSEYWTRAMELTGVSSSASRYMRFLLSERNYHLNTSYGAYPLATYGQGGVITFQEGNAPIYAEVRGMKELEVKVVLPKANSSHILGTSNINIPPPGTRVHLHYAKWQKRVSTGCRCIIKGMPSGKVLMNKYKQRNGHCRTTCDNDIGEFPTLPEGDTYATVTSSLHQTDRYGVYLAYPYINTTIKLPIIAVE